MYGKHRKMTIQLPSNFLMNRYTNNQLEVHLTNLLSSSDISEVSVKQYTTKIVQWLDYINIKKQKKILYNLVMLPEQSLKVLESMPSIKHTPQNHHIYISAVVALIKNVLMDTSTLFNPVFRKWKEIQKKNWAPIQEHYDSNEPSAKQANMILPFESLVQRIKELDEGSFERLLLAFYTLIPPMRADYFATQLFLQAPNSEPIEDNYIIISESRLVVKDFKTARKYEKIETILPKELMDELATSLRVQKPRKWLFVTAKNIAYSRSSFSQWANRVLSDIFNKPMNLTVLRHIYISHMIDAKTPTADMKDIAKHMGHSRALQRVYEWQK